MNNRAGEYKTNLTGELKYQSFLPRPLPPSPPIELDDDCVKLLSMANRSIGILEGVSRQMANIELFVSMYVRKEALLSNAVNKLVELGILRQTENVRRSRVFAYEDYLRILRKDT